MFAMDATKLQRFTAMIYREDGGYVSICPELDVASQGDTVEEASANLREAVELARREARREAQATTTSGLGRDAAPRATVRYEAIGNVRQP